MIKKLIILMKPASNYLFAGWLLIIIIVSSIPSIPTLKIHTARAEIRLDYLMHFCEYGLLAFLAFLSFTDIDFKMIYRKFFIITICLLAFALLDEFHQKLIPGRSFNPKDIMSNVTGILVAMVFCFVIFKKINRGN
jgi:VanZ family protein